MSTLKSINWALAWRRAIWTAFFAAFYGIVIYMAKDMAGTQPVIFGIILLAALVCAVAFVYSRDNREALLIAVLALCVHAFLEASYWSSVIDDTSTHAMREQSAAASRDVVNEKRRARYASSASGKGAGQLSAEVEMLKQDARWVTSAQCTNATAPASRAFCQEYYRLMADLAAAKEAANLENTVFHTTVEAVDIPRNLAKGALWLSDVTGMSVNAATNILVALMVLFIQAGLAFSLRIGWQPQEARTAAKAFAPISVASAPVQPVLAPRSPMVALEKMTGVKAAPVDTNNVRAVMENLLKDGVMYVGTAPGDKTPDPEGDGTPIAKPEAPKVEELTEDPKIVRPAVWHEESAPPVAPRTNGKRQRNHLNRKDQTVIQWLADGCSITDDETVFATGRQCFASYSSYCDGKRIPEKDRVPQKRMSTVLSGQLGTRIDGRGKRNGNGAVFPGLMINPIVAQIRRRVA